MRTHPGEEDSRHQPSQTGLKSLEFGCSVFTIKRCIRGVIDTCWLSALFPMSPRPRIYTKMRPKGIHRLLKTWCCDCGILQGAKRWICPDGQTSQHLAMSPQQRCHQLYSSAVDRPRRASGEPPSLGRRAGQGTPRDGNQGESAFGVAVS